jgi:multicomponent Na+:H+ antiporter subunit G
MNESVGITLISVGVAFNLLGALGLIRLPDVYNRLQAATKCVTLGTCMMLVGAGIADGGAEMIVKSLLCAGFVLLTSPVGAHALARGAHKGGVKLWEGSVVDKYAELEDASPGDESESKS